MRKSEDQENRDRERSPRRMPSAERREQILAAALPCFAHRGYVATGTRDLARAAGITEPILYRHFDGKSGIFRAAIERVGDRLTATLDAAVGGVRGAEERLKALASALPRMLDLHRDDLRVLNSAALVTGEPEIRDAASRCARRIGHALAAAFRGSGLRRGVRAETAGFLLLEVGMGASTLRPLVIPEIEAQDYVERVVRALLQGITG